jgi:hypothetical protein
MNYLENKMVKNFPSMVIPSKEGIQAFSFLFWIPAGVYPALDTGRE